MGFLRAVDQIEEVWRQTTPITLSTTPIGVYPKYAGWSVGEGNSQYGVWIANSDGTVDYFAREVWDITETITLPEGARPEYVYDGGQEMFVCDSALGAIYLVDRDDLTYTTYTDQALDSPACITWADGGFWAVSQLNGHLARTNLSDTITTIDTGYENSGYIAGVPQGPTIHHIIVINSVSDKIQIIKIEAGEMSILATENATIPTPQSLWSKNISHLYHGDSSNNLVLRESSDLSIISTNAIGMEAKYFYNTFGFELYFANDTGRFGVWDMMMEELTHSDGQIDGNCCGIVVTVDTQSS
ncbi:MAG: hypothetical protein Q8M92_03805 [Candidatus Subteraquimicrobiales bacterium]|nr:hypothetical protein [Candidatus Subteraquimicrobiales bacterium]